VWCFVKKSTGTTSNLPCSQHSGCKSVYEMGINVAPFIRVLLEKVVVDELKDIPRLL
jgi:hypothetical protein